MIRYILAALLFVTPVMAQTGNLSGGSVKATDSTTARTLAERYSSERFDPMDWGAKCDWNGTTGTDDAMAINDMFTAIRALSPKSFSVVTPGNRTCFIGSTINMTGLRMQIGSSVNLRLICATNGTPCVDALYSRWINFDKLYIEGRQTNAPSYGIQIGRISLASADMLYFDRPIIRGHFTQANFYSFASETSTIVDPFFLNDSLVSTARSMVLDGYNHYNITSSFVTQTLAVDTPQSYNEPTFIGGWYGSANTAAAPVWVGNVARLRMVGSYSSSEAAQCVELFQTGSNASYALLFDLHCETLTTDDVFLLTGGSGGSFSLLSMTYLDHSPHSSNSVFKANTGITAVYAPDLTVKLPWLQAGVSVQLFDDPSIWTVSGNIYLPAITHWTAPAAFSGDLCIGTTCHVAGISAANVATALGYTPAKSATTTTFTTSGTWTKSATAKQVFILLSGQGGCGGGGASLAVDGTGSGGGGGGGASQVRLGPIPAATLPAALTITASTPCVASAAGNAGAVGADMVVTGSGGIFIAARGGGAGAAGASATASGGGGGGSINAGGNASGASNGAAGSPFGAIGGANNSVFGGGGGGGQSSSAGVASRGGYTTSAGAGGGGGEGVLVGVAGGGNTYGGCSISCLAVNAGTDGRSGLASGGGGGGGGTAGVASANGTAGGNGGNYGGGGGGGGASAGGTGGTGGVGGPLVAIFVEIM